jgi:GntR family transcriptional regulator
MADRVVSAGIEGVSGALRMPLYHQIFLILRQQITDGLHEYDALIPGEQELAETYDVSRITAKRALDELAAEGLVVRERGRGTRVRYRPKARAFQSSMDGLLENLIAMGLETKVKLISFGYVPANEEVAAALSCPIGQEVQRSVRMRSVEGKPFSFLTTYVPADIGRRYDASDLANKPLLSLLERSGVQVDAASQAISATLADPGVAGHLGISAGSALLKINRIVKDREGRPVEYITALYRPDQYQYRMVLSRVQGETHNTWTPSQDAATTAKD